MRILHWIKRCLDIISKHLFVFTLSIGILAIVLACLTRFVWFNRMSRESFITTSTLTDAIDIAELSTAEFMYRGIADIYSDENRTKVSCYVCYNAVVKAGIDMKKVIFDIDSEKKEVAITLPDIEIKVTIIDEKSMVILPSDADAEIDTMLKYCKEDAENEARNSTELMSTARENLISAVEGLLAPILNRQGYSVIWI